LNRPAPGTTRITPAMAPGVTDHVWELDEPLAAIKTAGPINPAASGRLFRARVVE